MSIRPSRIASAAVLTMVAGAGALADRAFGTIDAVFDSFVPQPSFGQRYGNNPRSTGNGGNGRGAVARAKRAARTRRNIRARAGKRKAVRA